ncbi:ribonuclease R [Hippea maritima]|uniref:Ribonuclease R n=1 Tax=Hippea maritima (strain ATCC 700847 / DSM 10411 / MH2) TaxID=760142 RepID=F2LUB1_HIPMA|nr:ribonuclease R [Hippea maritima]AEA33437.1 ribonuclease R [Hippea maritima DSM 10411]
MSRYAIAILNFLSAKDYKPLSGSELRKALGVSKKRKTAFYKELRRLKKEGKIKKISKSRYVIALKKSQTPLLKGTLLKRSGFFYLRKGEDEVKLPQLINTVNATEGDEIIVKLQKSNIGITSKVVKVLKRRLKNVIGYLVKTPRGWIVNPTDRKVPFVISVGKIDKKLKEGWLVLVEIISFVEGKHTTVKGKIVKVYGDPYQLKIDKEVVIDKFGLPYEFSTEVERELEMIAEPTEDEFRKRTDFRNLPTITIDGEDARDFDDAIDVERTQTGYRLYVHIADVSNYVKKGMSLDKEALQRGFSVYFPEAVIPMLPFKLSNDVCSLVPDEDRLSVSVIMEISKKGVIKSYDIKESVIRNKRRMTYKGVQGILDGQIKDEQWLKDRLVIMRELAKTLRSRRFKKGSLDLDIPEPKVIVEDDKIIEIKEREHLFSHSIIEEFMLAANLCVADFLSRHYEKYIRRVHDDPDPVKLSVLIAFLRKMGVKFELQDEITSKELQKILKSIKDEKLKKIVSQLMLRSLKRAEYSTQSKGHFALHFENYTHFTSPIRRYPDLVVHRMIKAVLEKKRESFDNLEDITSTIKERELTTENAMFYMNDIKAAHFMRQYIGEVFDATITTIIPSGFFVRLKEHFVEGFVAVSSLKDDYYEYVEYMYAMVGKRKKKIFRLGDDVRVMVVNVDKFAGEIDFTVA